MQFMFRNTYLTFLSSGSQAVISSLSAPRLRVSNPQVLRAISISGIKRYFWIPITEKLFCFLIFSISSTGISLPEEIREEEKLRPSFRKEISGNSSPQITISTLSVAFPLPFVLLAWIYSSKVDSTVFSIPLERG